MARKALEVISTHNLTCNSHGGADVSMEKFENTLQDLDQIGQPYNLKTAKINFLNNITDDTYLVVKDSLEMDSKKSYHNALIEIRRKSISVEAKRSNNVRMSNKSTKKRNQDKDTRKMNIVHSKDWIPKEKWMKMSREERHEHLKKKNKKKNEKEDVPKPLPFQYSNANQMISEEKELYGIENNTNTSILKNREENMTPHQQKLVHFLRSMNMLKVTEYHPKTTPGAQNGSSSSNQTTIFISRMNMLRSGSDLSIASGRMSQDDEMHDLFHVMREMNEGSEEEATYMKELDTYRKLIEFFLRVANVLLTSCGDHYVSPALVAPSIKDYQEDETMDISSIATGDTLDIDNQKPCRYYDYKKGRVEIIHLPIQDPNFYDLHDKWSHNEDDLFWDKHDIDISILSPEDMEEVKAAIVHSLKLEKEARNKYLAPEIHTSSHGNFEYTYCPRYITIDQPLPEDNPYIKIFKKDGRNIFISRTAIAANSNSKPATKGEILIDGGCDTSLVGNGFLVESTTERMVSVQGFNEKIKIDKLPVVTALTIVVIQDIACILVINECIYVKGNTTSLLSTYQAREYGVQVNDVAARME